MRGQGSIYQRGSVYWVRYYLRGKEYRESARTDDPKKAERFLRHRIKEVGADQIGAKPFGGPQQDRLTINQLLDALRADYELRGKLTPQFGSHLARIRDYFGAVRATALSSETVDKYISEQLEAGLKPATVNRGTQLLRQGYQLAVERKHLHSMPSIRHLDERGNVRQGFFEEPELRRVISYLPEYIQDFTLYAFLTGWRKGGIKNLRWSDVTKQIIEDKEVSRKQCLWWASWRKSSPDAGPPGPS
jgi:integrase